MAVGRGVRVGEGVIVVVSSGVSVGAGTVVGDGMETAVDAVGSGMRTAAGATVAVRPGSDGDGGSWSHARRPSAIMDVSTSIAGSLNSNLIFILFTGCGPRSGAC
ncbi:MAG: hypothetical protein F4X94_06465 [Dehalococcoidia bacterium]|nr:hypothetical protein [Dehalococcoidia bacterium]